MDIPLIEELWDETPDAILATAADNTLERGSIITWSKLRTARSFS